MLRFIYKVNIYGCEKSMFSRIRLVFCSMIMSAGLRKIPKAVIRLRKMRAGATMASWEQHYSGFLCVALNDKKADGDR